MSSNVRALFLGLDSAEPDLIRKWCQSGDLPVLASLQKESVWGGTTTPAGFGNGVVWPSLFTGVNPGKHGRYFYRHVRPGDYQASPFVEDTDFKWPPIWQSASDKNKRVAVIDMVRAPLTRDINGIQLADWITHDRAGPTRSWPVDLVSDAIAQFGADPLDGCSEAIGRGHAEYKVLCDQMLARVAAKTELSLHYLKQGPWDLFMTAYAEPHDVGHQCWHIHDPSHPKFEPELARLVGDPIKNTYVAIDEGIGRLLKCVGPETVVVVFTGPGMGPDYTANHMLDRILRRLESGAGAAGTTFVDGLKSTYRRIAPPLLRNSLRKVAERSEEAMLIKDRKQRKYFAIPHNENAGAIRINLIGREPNGKVRPGAEYDDICATLKEDLMSIVNAETGEPLVSQVVKVAETCHGDHINELPDLLSVWHRPAPINKVRSPKIGEIGGSYPGNRTGDHTPRGLFFLRAPGVEPHEISEPVSVMDIGATISRFLGISTAELDGVPIAEPTAAGPAGRLRDQAVQKAMQ